MILLNINDTYYEENEISEKKLDKRVPAFSGD